MMGRERRRIDSGSLLASVDGDADVFLEDTNPWALAAPPAEKDFACRTSSAGVKKSDAASSPLANAAPGLKRPPAFELSLLKHTQI